MIIGINGFINISAKENNDLLAKEKTSYDSKSNIYPYFKGEGTIVGHSNIAYWNNGEFFETITYEDLGYSESTGKVTYRFRYYLTHKGSSSSYTYQTAPIQILVNGSVLANCNIVNQHVKNESKLGGQVDVAMYPDQWYNIVMRDDPSYTPGMTEVHMQKDVYFSLPSYTVKFLDWNGYTLKTQTVKKYKNATAPVSPTRVGYTFTGWDRGFTNVQSNLTINALYKVNQYTAKFNANGGTPSETSITTDYGSKLGTLPSATRQGYTFMGWYTNVSGGSKISSNTTMPLNGATYYAHWDAKPVIECKDFKVIEGDNFPSTNLMDGIGYITQGTSEFPDKLMSVHYPVIATDAEDGNLTSNVVISAIIGPDSTNVSYVNTSKIGVYTIYYSVSDKSGTAVSATRKITVLPSSTAEIFADDRYFFRGSDVTQKILKDKIIVKDKYDGNVTDKTKILNFDDIKSDKVGEYEITYTVTNRSRKTTTKKVVVYIIETVEDKQSIINLRYISKEYMDTLSNDSKWSSVTNLKRLLEESLNKKSESEAIYIYKFSNNDIKDIKRDIKENGFSQKNNIIFSDKTKKTK